MSSRHHKRMCPSSDERDRILQAHEMGGPPFHLPWRSFAEFFNERVHDAHRADKPFLTYYDESRGATEPVRRVFSSARFGDLVGRAATVLRELLALRPGARIVYTSGTTGPPKGVVLTARNLLVDADGIADWHGFRPDDRLMCVLPIHHVNGTVVTLVTPFYFGGGAVLNRKFKSSVFWRRI